MSKEHDQAEAEAIERVVLPQLMTLRELARALSRSERACSELLRAGVLPGVRVRGRWIVDRDALLAVLRPRIVQCTDCAVRVRLVDVEADAGTCPDCSRRLRSAGSP